jgi:hypothetical protein
MSLSGPYLSPIRFYQSPIKALAQVSAGIQKVPGKYHNSIKKNSLLLINHLKFQNNSRRVYQQNEKSRRCHRFKPIIFQHS